ncbi:MAG: 1-deoxy-D-xylulose-5-phosphate reductoisomerase [Acidobacteria bacterium]|nr:1-deoxy-D-xylulose-5-phosphate reductoisomerase [Acidobacteriota bacterium]
MSEIRGIAILGSTGSVGRNTLDVVRHLGAGYKIVALAAGRNAALLLEQIREFRPTLASLEEPEAAQELRQEATRLGTRLVTGRGSAMQVATCEGADLVMSAIVGAAGLRPTYAAVAAGRHVALANKEVLVVGGAAINAAARRSGAELLPVDSEHNALHQCLRAGRRDEVKRLFLTASGGPFWEREAATFAAITVEEALAHPVWDMGPKISIDSATMMNKGLEVIEAHWLFDMDPDHLSVLVHPGSVVHSLVEFVDGSLVAQMGSADMRHPIQYALTWPDRCPGQSRHLDLTALPPLRFYQPDPVRFPCLGLAYEALKAGPLVPAILNGANEAAVAEFLAGRMGFMDIPQCLTRVLERAMTDESRLGAHGEPGVDDCLEADRWGREAALAAHETLCLPGEGETTR